jgi:expansin
MKYINYLILFLSITINTIKSQETYTSLDVNNSFSNCKEIFKGEGTYYEYTGGGNCSYTTPSSPIYTGAMNESQYNGSSICGVCVEVTGERGSLIITIEDRCPECKFGDIDLTKEAFPKIADPVKGRVPISWKIVECPYTKPIKFVFKEGSTQYWNAIQVRNHKNPIAKLEYKINNVYKIAARQLYNYFVAPAGSGPGPFNLRITDIYGNVIEEKNIPLKLDQEIIGLHQFPSCSPLSSDNLNGNNSIMNPLIKLYPNPVKEELFIQYSLIENAEVSFMIYDILGNEVLKIPKEVQYFGEIKKNINVEKLQKGIYYLKMNMNQEYYIKKVIID